MKAKIRKVRQEYGGEISVIALVLVAVLGYAYWGSMFIN